jgi:transcriptional regulator with GAF, ATPase, and Fis domain
VQVHRASGGAVLRPRESEAELWISAGLSLRGAADLRGRWEAHSALLATGQQVIEAGFALVPAMLDGQLVAAVYLVQPDASVWSDGRVFGTAIAQAVRAADANGGPVRLPEASPTEEAKLQLLSLLERNEWNLAKVARLMGVTRRTVYLRLRSFGIERRHVPKLYKKLPVG